MIVPTGFPSKYLAIGKALIEETFVKDDIFAVIPTPSVLIFAVIAFAVIAFIVDVFIVDILPKPALIVDVVIAPAFIVERLPLNTFRFVVLTVLNEPTVMFARGPLIVLRKVTVPS
jgi:hypothetical protein